MPRTCFGVVPGVLFLAALLFGAETRAFTPPNDAVELGASTATLIDQAVLLSPAEKVGRELRFDESRRVTGEASRTVWQLAPGTGLEAAFEAAAAQLVGDVLYSCAGRRCGRSTAWANLVFKDALLYGQDRYQRYRVVQSSPSQLHLLYAIQRGNRRIHLLLETIGTTATDSADDALAPTSDVQLAAVRSALTDAGAAQLRVVPGALGSLDGAALTALSATGGALAGLKVAELYVVCHVYGADVAETLLAASNDCAASAVAALQEGHAAGLGEALSAESRNRARPAAITFVPFGAGPLLPRLPTGSSEQTVASPVNRIELIAPARLWR